MRVITEWAFGNIEDVGDEPMLTTAPLEAGALTGETSYMGNPQVIHDVGVGNNALTDIWKTVVSVKQTFEPSYKDSGNEVVTYIFQFNAVQIALFAVFAVGTVWDDFIDRDIAKEMSIKSYKPDVAKYITRNFTNVAFTKYEKSGPALDGFYESVILANAEAMTVTAVPIVGAGTYATHYKVV